MVLIKEILNKLYSSQICGNLEVRTILCSLPQSVPGPFSFLFLLHMGGMFNYRGSGDTMHAYILSSFINVLIF